MIKFKGRSSLKQFNPMKSIKRGFKLWCLSDDKRYGYKFDIYCGKNDSTENTTLGLGSNVAMKLVNQQSIIRSILTTFFIHWSDGNIEAEKILVCCTIHSLRKNFPALQDYKSLKRGQFDYRSTADQIAVYKWKDSKAVNLSNYHGIDSAKVDRKEKDRRKIKVPCPKVV